VEETERGTVGRNWDKNGGGGQLKRVGKKSVWVQLSVRKGLGKERKDSLFNDAQHRRLKKKGLGKGT